jgi:hypothetical protein
MNRSDNLLDMSDLQCPEGHGQMGVGYNWAITDDAPIRETKGYMCVECRYFITRIEFTRNAHGTREQRRLRIANRELGRS